MKVRAIRGAVQVDADEREAMRSDVPRLGLDTPHRSRTFRDIALEVLDIARKYWDQGIRHIVALRGDAPAGTELGVSAFRAAISRASSVLSENRASCFPSRTNSVADSLASGNRPVQRRKANFSLRGRIRLIRWTCFSSLRESQPRSCGNMRG